MNKTLLELLGFAGNALLIIGYLPQIHKTMKSKQANDISLWMWVTYLVGEVMLLIYAVSVNELIMMILLCVFILGDLSIIGLKLKYGFSKKHVTE